MNLPSKISPVPILTASLEIRYKSELNISDFGKLLVIKLNKMDGDLNIFPTYSNEDNGKTILLGFIFRNDSFGFRFNANSFLFEYFNTYSSWSNYFNFVKNCLNVIYEIGIICKIDRVGLRYDNVFVDSFDQVLNKVPSLDLQQKYSEASFFEYKMFIKSNEVGLILQLYLKENEKISPKNYYHIDIDAFIENIDIELEHLLVTIDKLHLEEKKFFFQLLNKDYITKLKPEYNDGTPSTSN